MGGNFMLIINHLRKIALFEVAPGKNTLAEGAGYMA